MKNLLVLNSVFLFMLGASCAAAQVPAQVPAPTPPPPPYGSVNDAGNVARSSPEIRRKNARLEEDKYLTRGDKETGTLSAVELSEAAREKVKVGKQEKLLYKELTKANDLKILKMFSAPQCAANKLVFDAADEKCAGSADLLRASFYSFIIGYYGETIGDFRILEDSLIAGNGSYVHGFLADLGETDIGALGKESSSVTSLINYPLAVTTKDAAKQKSDLEKGFRYQDLEISSERTLKPGHVYLMRLVSYVSGDDLRNGYNKDAVYLLKAANLTNDGMATILWKRLSQKFAPRLKDE